jgi:hypothetical protein
VSVIPSWVCTYPSLGVDEKISVSQLSFMQHVRILSHSSTQLNSNHSQTDTRTPTHDPPSISLNRSNPAHPHKYFPRTSLNTAILSSILLPRTVSFSADANRPPPSRSNNLDPTAASSGTSKMSETKTGRRRRSSSIIYHEPLESIEHSADQAALPNLNANWVNAKGTFIFVPIYLYRVGKTERS